MEFIKRSKAPTITQDDMKKYPVIIIGYGSFFSYDCHQWDNHYRCYQHVKVDSEIKMTRSSVQFLCGKPIPNYSTIISTLLNKKPDFVDYYTELKQLKEDINHRLWMGWDYGIWSEIILFNPKTKKMVLRRFMHERQPRYDRDIIKTTWSTTKPNSMASNKMTHKSNVQKKSIGEYRKITGNIKSLGKNFKKLI